MRSGAGLGGGAGAGRDALPGGAAAGGCAGSGPRWDVAGGCWDPSGDGAPRYFFYCLPGPCEPLPPALLLPPPAALPDGAAPTAAGDAGPALGGGSRRFPQAIIVGVKKGGTRALLEFLRVHPGVRAVGAEPHFFDRCYEKGLRWYR